MLDKWNIVSPTLSQENLNTLRLKSDENSLLLEYVKIQGK